MIFGCFCPVENPRLSRNTWRCHFYCVINRHKVDILKFLNKTKIAILLQKVQKFHVHRHIWWPMGNKTVKNRSPYVIKQIIEPCYDYVIYKVWSIENNNCDLNLCKKKKKNRFHHSTLIFQWPHISDWSIHTLQLIQIWLCLNTSSHIFAKLFKVMSKR